MHSLQTLNYYISEFLNKILTEYFLKPRRYNLRTPCTRTKKKPNPSQRKKKKNQNKIGKQKPHQPVKLDLFENDTNA